MLPKIKLSRRALKKAAPTILTCVGAVGVVLTAVFTGKAAVKASKKIEEAKTIKMEETGEKLTVMETIEECWKDYVPPIVVGAATVGCILSSNILNRRQMASAMAAYAFAMKSLKDYKSAVRDEFGVEGEQKIIKRMVNDKYTESFTHEDLWSDDFDFGALNEEEHPFYLVYSEDLFPSTCVDVLTAEMKINEILANCGYAPFHAFCDYLGRPTPPELDGTYWYANDKCKFIKFKHSRQYIDDGLNNDPIECWAIEMVSEPVLDPFDGI